MYVNTPANYTFPFAEHEGMDSSESAIGRAVQSWRSATETYTQIFEALSTATAARLEEGKDESYHHAAFEAMAKTARAAWDACSTFTFNENARSFWQHPTVSSGEDTDDIKEDDPDLLESANGLITSRTIALRKQRRERKLRKRVARLANVHVRHAHTAARSEHIQSPAIEYEDISAEIEARLRRRDEQKAAAMVERKRKRGSADSLESMTADANAGGIDAKRIKLHEIDCADTEGRQVRRKHYIDGEEDDTGRSRYKRQKVNRT